MSKNMNLDDMMEQPRNAPISFDVTKGKPTNIPSNEARVNPLSTMQPSDLSNVQPVDISKIARKKPVAEETKEDPNPLMSSLRKAVDREKESITNRIQQLEEVQRQEFEEEMEKKTEELLDGDEDISVDIPNATKHETIDTHARQTEVDDEADLDLDSEEDDEEKYNIPAEKYDRNVFNAKYAPVVGKYTPVVSKYSPVVAEVEEPSEDSNDEEPAQEIAAEAEVVPDPDPDEELKTSSRITKVVEEEYNEEPAAPEDIDDVNIVEGVSNADLFDDDDTEEGDTEEEEEERASKILDTLKTELKEKSTKIKASLDLSKFTVAKKSANAQKIMKIAVESHRKTADWVLYGENRPFSAIGLSGAEIIKMNPENSSRNRLNTFRDIYRIIYEHIQDANKPEFETWCKQVKYVDLPHLYFGLYMATFSGSNFLTYTCPKCNKVFIQDVDFMDMIEYADDEAKAKVVEMLKLDTTSPKKYEYDIEIVQVSDKFAFGIHTPSLYNIIMETASVSEKFLSTYSDLMDTIAYIDTIYYIDVENQELIPIDTKPVPNDIAKTSARKIKIFHSIINKLSSSEFYALRAKIADYSSDTTDKILYKIPECTCPECGEKIEEQKPVGPDSLLFTRHQLEAIGSL